MGAFSHRHNQLVAHPKGSERGGLLLPAWYPAVTGVKISKTGEHAAFYLYIMRVIVM